MKSILKKFSFFLKKYFFIYSVYRFFSQDQILHSKILNNFFLQSYRFNLAREKINSRQKRLLKNIDDKEILDHFSALKKDGILIIKNFLDQKSLDEIESFYNSTNLAGKTSLNKFRLRGADYLDGNLSENLPKTFSFILGNKIIKHLPKLYLGNTAENQYWRLKFIKDIPGMMDENCNNHSDTFHNTLKIWIYLEDIEKDEDTLKYWKKSHLPNHILDKYRIKKLVEGVGSPRAENQLMESLRFNLFNEKIKKNTLVMADTSGFHYRNFAKGKDLWRGTIFTSIRINPFFN